MAFIDINADAGESFGNWRSANEEELFPYLSSVNLACGFHAGDPLNIQKSVNLAIKQNLAIGAHPSFNDLLGFGRRLMAVSKEEIYADIVYQLGALDGFLKIKNTKLSYVKPHGALYLVILKDIEIANAVVQAIFDYDKTLPVLTLAGSGGNLVRKVAENIGLRVIAEAFPDRAYLANGLLAPRTIAGAVFNDAELISKRAVLMGKGQAFASLDGGELILEADTLCIHGDNSNSVTTAKKIKQALNQAKIAIKAF